MNLAGKADDDHHREEQKVSSLALVDKMFIVVFRHQFKWLMPTNISTFSFCSRYLNIEQIDSVYRHARAYVCVSL